MVITELYIKNFGRLSDRRYYLKDGVQVISGENESGKTTLHAFIRAMLFGMERGRGRAAAKDDFSRYEPWDDPGSYAGVMRFTCGGRSFRLERNFARQTKYGSLVCEDDGEELSVEHGDLEMLMGGMTAELFDNTVSIGQLRAEPGQELSDALANYAANYYETGGGEYDLSRALKILDEKKRAVRRELREEEAAHSEKQKELLREGRYLEEDIRRLGREYSGKIKELDELKAAGSRENTDGGPGRSADRPSSGAGHITGLIISGTALLFAGILGLLGSCAAAGWTWSGAVSLPAAAAAAGIVGGCILLTAGWMRRTRASGNRPAKSGEQRPGKGVGDQGGRNEAGSIEKRKRLEWEAERIRAEQREKETRRDNIMEECEEPKKGDRMLGLEEQEQALELAAAEMHKAARVTAETMDRRVSRRASEIFSAITDGKYRLLETDRQRGITVWDGERRIPAGRLSRGTVEQIYFCIRMAAAEILTEEPVPVILDDVFAFYDDKRLESVLKWLNAQKKQVIIFTCHRREEEILHCLG